MEDDVLIELEVSYCKSLNYAMQQNHVPIIREIILKNNSPQDISNLTVTISNSIGLAEQWNKQIDILPADDVLSIDIVDIKLSSTFLAELTERLVGEMVLTVLQGEAKRSSKTLPIEVLTFDEWGGLAVLPEMVAAFITPNHPDVMRLTRVAADIFAEWVPNPSFDGYQMQDSTRSRQQVAAVYHAIQRENITYSILPPSFEEMGQRIRLPDTLFTYRMGNCLDLTLLLASCLEAIGLHPIVVFTEGHAFVGSWLVNETFPESVQDDVSLLKKRTAEGIREMCLVESTLVTSKEPVTFEEAERVGLSNIDSEEKFLLFVDVKRARYATIRPLPLRVKTEAGWSFEQDAKPQTGIVTYSAPDDVEVFEPPIEVETITHPKQKEWERRLLDLSLRNTLLNFRGTQSSIPLLINELNGLEDALANQEEFQLLAAPNDWLKTPRDADTFHHVENKSPMSVLLREEFRQNRLRADLSETDLQKRSINLYRSARASLEENGANTLYLALGFLKWYETNVSERARYAPMVLVPIEIVRKSSRLGFVIRQRDEETQFNITLLEMLRQDFGTDVDGLDPLPRDDSGVDLRRIFTLVRHVIMNKRRWDVEERAHLGLFSFGQFVMWNDLRARSADLSKNIVVASLMSGQMQWQALGVIENEEKLDSKYKPQQLLAPISADSSQLKAIAAADEGESFVLHGPPGTGKSQTITNIIAHMLGQGKTVLFVAEKMAALTVVQRRLTQIGLDPFCLELHSSKSNKRSVLEQMRTTLETAKTVSPEAWEKEATRLAESRASLNRFSEALHAKHSNGLSVYEAITLFERVRSAPEVVHLDAKLVAELSKDQMRDWIEAVTALQIAGQSCGGPHLHPLKEFECRDYITALKSQSLDALNDYVKKLDACQCTLDALTRVMSWKVVPDMTRDRLRVLNELCIVLSDVPDISSDYVTVVNWKEAVQQLNHVADHGLRRDALRTNLFEDYRQDILDFDAKTLHGEWQKTSNVWALPRRLKRSRILKQMKPFWLNGKKVSSDRIEQDLAQIVKFQEEERIVRESASRVSSWLGQSLWNHGNADWAALQAASAWREKLANTLHRLMIDETGMPTEFTSGIAQALEMGQVPFLTTYGQRLHDFMEATAKLNVAERVLSELLFINLNRIAEQSGRNEAWLNLMLEKTRIWQDHIEGLRDWCTWQRVRSQLTDMGLTDLVLAWEEGKLIGETVVPAFRRALYKASSEQMVDKDPQLNTFSSRLFEDAIRQFASLTDDYEQLTKKEIVSRLTLRVPRTSQSVANNSELGLLLRSIRSGGRGLPLRKLFNQIPNLMPRISPCMLMSPISVAQYLDPATPMFDVVIFDEASQMPTAQAVGAMARGKSVIVVGDPNQLPPTRFFASANRDSEDNDLSEDLESVLDDCLALGMPQGHLLWHYRSRREGLIAFSNRHYYDNKLLTFPSANELTQSVRCVHVEGFYDRGRSKQNRAEAEAVIDEITRRLRHPVLQKESIGVVTFNLQQKNLIEDLIEEAFQREPELELAATESNEPLLIKNLENVQGDERGVILFSVGYGPDEHGRVNLNFGPLNREGGWRRLNVAVSRARNEMIVFSTLRADHIDVSRVGARGVIGLKSFLEYAEKGKKVLAVRSSSQISEATLGLEREIAQSLRALGHTVDENVGSSGYRVDLAILDPDCVGKYILGITTDGHTYQSANTARDRDVLRARVLEQLEWNVHRVWSLDWWENPNRELERITQAIDEARTVNKMNDEQVDLSAFDSAVTQTQGSSSTTIGVSKIAALSVPQTEASEEMTQPYSIVTYKAAILAPVNLSSEEFHSGSQTRLIMDQIAQIVEVEGPISRSLTCHRTLNAWGIKRLGNRVDKRFDQIFALMKLKKTKQAGGTFFWPVDMEPSAYDCFRSADGDGVERRSAGDLPIQEIVSATKYILASQISLPKVQLIREVARVMGYHRTGAALDKAIGQGVDAAVKRGLVAWDAYQERVVDKV